MTPRQRRLCHCLDTSPLLQHGVQGLSALHQGLFVALQQDCPCCITVWQSLGYHSNAAESKSLGQDTGHPKHPAGAGILRGPQTPRSQTPARSHERLDRNSSPGPSSSPFQSQRSPQRPPIRSPRGQSYKPSNQHECWEPWKGRTNRLNGTNQRPQWTPASAELSAGPQRAQSEKGPPVLSAARSPAFGAGPEHHAHPRGHEAPVRPPHNADEAKVRLASDTSAKQQLSAPAQQGAAGGSPLAGA